MSFQPVPSNPKNLFLGGQYVGMDNPLVGAFIALSVPQEAVSGASILDLPGFQSISVCLVNHPGSTGLSRDDLLSNPNSITPMFSPGIGATLSGALSDNNGNLDGGDEFFLLRVSGGSGDPFLLDYAHIVFGDPVTFDYASSITTSGVVFESRAGGFGPDDLSKALGPPDSQQHVGIAGGTLIFGFPSTTDVPVIPEPSLTGDSFLNKGQKNTNEGANHYLVVQKRGRKQTVVGFDLSRVTGDVSQATLIMTLAKPAKWWGHQGRMVDVHRLLEPFTEGNGFVLGRPWDWGNRGCGSGVTWHCATDTEIGNRKPDCDTRWQGGLDFIDPTTDSTVVTNGQIGEVSWDVTVDVQNALADGASEIQWMLKKANEHLRGSAVFYSKEGAADMGDMTEAPRLELEFSD